MGWVHKLGEGMQTKLTTAAMAASIAVALTGSSIAIAASTGGTSVKACASKKGHTLALLHHGGCASGFKKVTLGARGPKGAPGNRGATGKRGPGAISETLTNPNDDLQRVFPTVVGGVNIATSCGVAANVGIVLAPTTGTLDASGTAAQDGSLASVDQDAVTNIVTGGTTKADVDVVVSANGGSFIRVDVHGEHDTGVCKFWAVVIPAATPTVTPLVRARGGVSGR
jgi:hypothetical protein